MSLHTSDVIDYFFPASKRIACTKPEDVGKVKFVCNCGTTRVCLLKTGFSNLMSHIRSQHPNYEKDFVASNDRRSDIYFVNKDALEATEYIDFLLTSNQPFSLGNNPHL